MRAMMKRFLRKLKTLVKAAAGKSLIARPDVVVRKEKFGSDYGGWDVAGELIGHHSVVYSFGVGEDASFDTALINRYGLTVHAFDPTPRSIEWVKRQGFSDRFIMHEYGLADFDGDVSFNPPENPDHISHTLLERQATHGRSITVPVRRLRTIMKELGHSQIDILKMDIEGAEYDVIDDLAKSNVRPRQILVEFHHRFPSVGVKRTQDAVEKLRSIGYQLFSVSDSAEEFGFIWKST